MRFSFKSRTTLEDLLGELRIGMRRLSFAENFYSFEWTGTIAAATEVSIQNLFRDGTIPSKWVVTDVQGSNTVVRGDTAWDGKRLYLKNVSATDDSTLTVSFFK